MSEKNEAVKELRGDDPDSTYTALALNNQFKMIGKRKRDTAVVSRSSKTEDEEQTSTVADTSSHDLFRKFFEAQFEPLELPGGQINREQESQEDEQDDSDGSESESDWDGVSEEDEGNQVEVVEYQDRTTKDKEILDKKAWKAFMVCLPGGNRISCGYTKLYELARPQSHLHCLRSRQPQNLLPKRPRTKRRMTMMLWMRNT